MIRPLLCAALALFATAGCRGVKDLEDEVPCDNVGYAIASRTLDCTDDVDLANARYEAFAATYACIADKPGEEDFVCAISINGASCDDVTAYGNDLDAWLLREGECANILTAFDGDPLPRPQAGSDAVQDNPVCRRAVTEVYTSLSMCTPGSLTPLSEFEARRDAAPAEVNATYRCLARWPDGLPVPLEQADACVAEGQAADCASILGQSITALMGALTSCAALVEAR